MGAEGTGVYTIPTQPNSYQPMSTRSQQMVQTICEHELEYHKCCDVVICKKCGQRWGDTFVTTTPPYIPYIPYFPPEPIPPYNPYPIWYTTCSGSAQI